MPFPIDGDQLLYNPLSLNGFINSRVGPSPSGSGGQGLSFFAKRARGMMSKYIIKNRVQFIEDLHSFNDNGYEFQPDQSDNHELVYIRG